MTTDQLIEDLLKEDEDELKAKRKRLKSFGALLEDLRRSQTSAAEAADLLVEAGDLTKADAARIFDLSKPERMVLFPTTRATSTSASEPSVEAPDVTDAGTSTAELPAH